MIALNDAVAVAIPRTRPAERRAAAPARPAEEARPLLFEAVATKRSHEGAVFAAMAVLVAVLAGLGAWMTLDIAAGVRIAEECQGRCSSSTTGE